MIRILKFLWCKKSLRINDTFTIIISFMIAKGRTDNGRLVIRSHRICKTAEHPNQIGCTFVV